MTTTPLAGARIKAVNTPAPSVVSAAASGTLSATTTTAADITGATVTFTTVNANAVALVIGVFDVNTTATGSTAVGTCVADGATQNSEAIHALTTLNSRETVSQAWNVALASAGSHTIKLQGALSTASGTASFGATHTTITVLVLDW